MHMVMENDLENYKLFVFATAGIYCLTTHGYHFPTAFLCVPIFGLTKRCEHLMIEYKYIYIYICNIYLETCEI